MTYNDYFDKYLLDHKLLLRKDKNRIIAKFRKENYFLYIKNYNLDIENWQSNFDWDELPIDRKYNFIKLGYNESIWDLGSAPIKYVIPRIIRINKSKINSYYFNIMINKCLLKRSSYEKRVMWIKMKYLCHKNKAFTNFKFIQLPDDLFCNVISYII